MKVKMYSKQIRVWALTWVLLIGATSAQGQVTIGSKEVSAQGALLDLKQYNAATPGGATSQRGLLISRVLLKTLSIPSGTDLKSTIDGATGTVAWDKEEHIGLVIYNVGKVDAICPGLYVWDGDLWQKLGE